jgi:DNA-binding HxlR family transcriptional regulator
MCNDSVCICPLEGIIDTISKKWALVLIATLGNHQRLRFNQLMHELEGISPKTLTDTLNALRKEGLVGREAFSEIPPRVEYFLTTDGTEIRTAIIPLMEWANRRETTRGSCPPECAKRVSQ